MDYLFFYGHTALDSKIGKECLSQWYPCSFKDEEGVLYCSAEQYMMAEKARLFEDHDALKLILETEDPKIAKMTGRKVKGFHPLVWDRYKKIIVIRGNELKFSQNKTLKNFLLNTGDKKLVEASPYDKVWGIGMRANDPDVLNEGKWKGENLLGKCLMSVRGILKKEEK